jgi:aryl-alcohol dehydrogenase-like predicted oxidoreductase
MTDMRTRLLGRSALRVSELSLGTMTFGTEWGTGATPEESRRMFDAYVAAGGNFIDTANRYTEGTSERIVGECIASDRGRFVVATKYTLFERPGDPNAAGNHRKNLVQTLEASLKRLGTDYVDLLWIHAWDGLTPLDEVMRALDDQVRLGKVLHVGFSDAPAWVVSRAHTVAELRGWTPFTALQVEYSLVTRDIERDLLPMARHLGLAVTPWSPLGRGILTGKYTDASRAAEPKRLNPQTSKVVNERSLGIARVVDDIARELGKPPAQVALNWVRSRGTDIVPIIGARSVAQLRENLGALSWSLPGEALQRLEEASRIVLGFPHDFIASENGQQLIHGGTLPRLQRG